MAVYRPGERVKVVADNIGAIPQPYVAGNYIGCEGTVVCTSIPGHWCRDELSVPVRLDQGSEYLWFAPDELAPLTDPGAAKVIEQANRFAARVRVVDIPLEVIS